MNTHVDIDRDAFQSIGDLAASIVGKFRGERLWDGKPISEPGIYRKIAMDAYHGQLTVYANNRDRAAHIWTAMLEVAATIPIPGQFLPMEDGEFNGDEFENGLTAEDLARIDAAWETHKAALPVAVVIDDNQPGRTAIIEITIDPPTLGVGSKLYAEPKAISHPADGWRDIEGQK